MYEVSEEYEVEAENVIVTAQIQKYGSEIFKFYLLGTMPLDSDGEYSEDLLVERANSELVGYIANFVYRTLSFLNKNFDSKIWKETVL